MCRQTHPGSIFFSKYSQKCNEKLREAPIFLTNKNRLTQAPRSSSFNPLPHGKNGFVTATKLGITSEFFVASTKNFAAAIKRFVDRTKHFVVVTKYFCYPYFNK